MYQNQKYKYMLKIYVLQPRKKPFSGQRAKTVIESTCGWACKAIGDGKILNKFELVNKVEYFIAPNDVMISGKQFAGSILKIKVSEFLKIKRKSLLKIQEQINISHDSILVFQRIVK